MIETNTADLNVFDRANRADPYAVYTRLREESPVHDTGLGIWVISRYDDCVSALREPRFSSNPKNSNLFRQAVDQGLFDPDQELLGKTPPFLVQDPPSHTRLRSLVSKAFTPRAVERMRNHVRAHVHGLLDIAGRKGGMEVMEDLAYPLPVTVICEMLGVAPEDRGVFREWSGDLSRGMDIVDALNANAVERRRRAGNAFTEYFRSLVAVRRTRPGNDLLTALIAAEEAGEQLAEEELISTCILLLAAGHETTVSLIGNGVLAFARHPEQFERLRHDPSLAAGAVEEVLRYDAPVQMAMRSAVEDVDIHGTTIPRGAQVFVLLASANRDPAQFPSAGAFDIGRSECRHLAFGVGAHSCLGAPLARMEGELVFCALAERFSRVELVSETLAYKENIVNRGLRSLPVRLAPA